MSSFLHKDTHALLPSGPAKKSGNVELELGDDAEHDASEERTSLVSGSTNVVRRYDACNHCSGCIALVVAVLVTLNVILTASLVAVVHSSSAACPAIAYSNSACVNLCSPVCAGFSGAGCFAGCFKACNNTATATFARPAVLGTWLAPDAIQHVGVTTSNLSRSVRFYTEIMGGVEVVSAGGDGWKGDDVYQLLMQYALMQGPATAQWAANLSSSGTETLSARYVSFGTMVVEILDYFSPEASMQRALAMGNNSSSGGNTIGEFPKWSSSNAAPSVVQNMHFSFNVRPELDLNEFVNALEAQAHAAGYSNVVCNRLVKVPLGPDGSPDYAAVPLTDNSYVVTSGGFKGWHLAYCKGPDGEQLEFNQVADDAAVDFNQALQAYLAGETNDLWR